MNLPQGSIDHSIRLAIACHDLGKLSISWQEWAWEWQQFLYRHKNWPLSLLPETPFFFAKTDFDHSKEQKELQRNMKRQRPNHACESVVLGIDMIADSLGVSGPESKLFPLLFAVCGAIARHHTPQAHEYRDVLLSPGAERAIKDAFEEVRQNTDWQYDVSFLEKGFIKGGNLTPEDADAYITQPKMGRIHELETWLYFVIVRALRLADQRAGIPW
jgi:CRISPR-associated endonuclease/helicase Cas3